MEGSCFVCLKDTNALKFTIFDKDETTERYLFYKIHNIIGQEIGLPRDDSIICYDCHALLVQISILEKRFAKCYQPRNNDEPKVIDVKREQIDALNNVELARLELLVDTSINEPEINSKGNTEEPIAEINELENDYESTEVDNFTIENEPENNNNEIFETKTLVEIFDRNLKPNHEQKQKKSQIQSHVERVHSRRPYKRKKIGFLKSKLRTQQAERLILNEDPQICQECQKSYPGKAELFAHEYEVHRGDRSRTCQFCQKSFSSKNELVVHLRGHTNERPFQCKECGRNFTQRPNFISHANSHLAIKPYKCDVCPKSYASKRNLVYHEGAHQHKDLLKQEFTKTES